MFNLLHRCESVILWVSVGLIVLLTCGWFLLMVVGTIHDYRVHKRIVRRINHITRGSK